VSATPGEQIDAVEALQAALAAEHAAVHGYAFIGARSSGEDRTRAAEHREAHVSRRDGLHAELVQRESEPVASEVAYPLPEHTDEEDLAEFAAELEEDCAQAYLQLAGTGEPATRDLARRALTETAVRCLAWGRPPSAFPGFPGGAPPS
jgi:hypothetical protein